jgi:hypothetical protein
MKLTPEQIEDILSGLAPQDDDLDAEDIARLDEARAMRARLAAAFDSTHASDSLADKVRASLQTASARRRRYIYFPTGILMAASVAAMMILVPVLYILLMMSEPALAGTVALANIHKVNLTTPTGFRATGDCEEIRAYFKRELDFTPKLLDQCPDLNIVGCYVTKLNGKLVATYVVQLNDARASVIVTEDWPKKFGLGCGCGSPHCKCIHNGQCGEFSIASVRLGERSYSVVGKLPAELLRGVLERLRG